MRISITGLLLLIAASPAAAQGTQESPRAPLMFEVAARGYLAGGRMGSLAGDSAADRLESYVWADRSLCALGAGDQAPADTPWTGWHFTGAVVSTTSGQMTVRIDWRRMWENGVRTSNAASGSQTLTLRSGERVELDRVVPTSGGRCGTIEAKLEAAVMTRAAYLVGVQGGVAGGVPGGVATGTRGGGSGGGRGGRVGGAASGGTTTGAAGGVPSRGGGAGATSVEPRGTQAGAAAGAQGGGGRGGARGGTATGTPGGLQLDYNNLQYRNLGSHDAEIWLVHKKPDGSEVVQQQTVRFGGAPKQFAFPPVQVAGSGGPITIDITGSVQALNALGSRYLAMQMFAARGYTLTRGGGAGGGRGAAAPSATVETDPAQGSLFSISIARRARRTAPFLDTRGATDISLQIPKSDDVLSFELPQLQKSTEDLLKGNTFSLRLRVTAVK